jgi:hypothetical protein
MKVAFNLSAIDLYQKIWSQLGLSYKRVTCSLVADEIQDAKLLAEIGIN